MAACAGAGLIMATGGAVQAVVRPSRVPPPPPPGSSNPLVPTGRMIQRFSAANMTSWSGTQAAAVTVAKTYDVISVQPNQFASYLPAMRSANPKLVVLVYINGTFVRPGNSSSYPSSWFLHDASGQIVTSMGWGNQVMDPTNAGWVANRAQTCASLITGGFDGCMIDMLGDAPTQPGYLSALVINPATNKPYTSADWLIATTKLGTAVAQAVAPKVVVGNGLGSGPRYFNSIGPSSQLLAGMQGGVGEGWLKNPGASATAFPTEANFKQNVDALVDAGNRGRSVMAITKTWGGGTQAQIDAFHRYALASFLLGTNGSSYFSFSSANNQAGIVNDSPWEHVNVGLPAGSYSKVGNVYERSFTMGMALVNPTKVSSTVGLPHSYCNLAGAKVNSVVLASNEAEVLYSC